MRHTMVLWWIGSLVVVATLASALAFAQARQEPRVLSGNDIGFRVEGVNRAGEPVGALVVRINGAWVPVGSAPTVHRAQ